MNALFGHNSNAEKMHDGNDLRRIVLFYSDGDEVMHRHRVVNTVHYLTPTSPE